MDSRAAWTNVWSNVKQQGGYAFRDGRFERALNKIDHFRELGISFTKDERVLEAGCGDGAIIVTLQNLYGIKGFGADFAPSAQLQAQSLMRDEDVSFNFILSDIRCLPFEDHYFDKIVCLGVVEHMEDPVAPLRELCRVLKPGGQAIIMTPNILSAGFADRVIQQALGTWQMGFQKEFSPRKLARFMKHAGFSGVTKTAIKRPALSRDSGFRRLASNIDRYLRHIIPNWGFYSYSVATKR